MVHAALPDVEHSDWLRTCYAAQLDRHVQPPPHALQLLHCCTVLGPGHAPGPALAPRTQLLAEAFLTCWDPMQLQRCQGAPRLSTSAAPGAACRLPQEPQQPLCMHPHPAHIMPGLLP